MSNLNGKALAAVATVFCAHVALASAPAAPQDRRPISTQALVSPAVLSESTAPSSEIIASADPTPMLAADGAGLSPLDLDEVECIAKVVRHEAANQPLAGQVAVAKVVRARIHDGRFPKTACAVVRQHGQFFDIDAYDPPRNDARWNTAVRIATQVLTEDEAASQGDALFFQSGGTPMSGRVRVMRIADHTFYR